MMLSYSSLQNALSVFFFFFITDVIERRIRDQSLESNSRQQWDSAESFSTPISGCDVLRSTEVQPVPSNQHHFSWHYLFPQFVLSQKTQYPVVMTPSQHFLCFQLKKYKDARKNLPKKGCFSLEGQFQSLITTKSTLYCSITMKHKIEIGIFFGFVLLFSISNTSHLLGIKESAHRYYKFFSPQERQIVENAT